MGVSHKKSGQKPCWEPALASPTTVKHGAVVGAALGDVLGDALHHCASVLLALAAMLSCVSLPSTAEPAHVSLALVSAALHVPEQKRDMSLLLPFVRSHPGAGATIARYASPHGSHQPSAPVAASAMAVLPSLAHSTSAVLSTVLQGSAQKRLGSVELLLVMSQPPAATPSFIALCATPHGELLEAPHAVL